MTKLNALLDVPLNWERVPGRVGAWFTRYKGREFHLNLQDFPDYPMYALHGYDEAIEFDDRPSFWTID